MQVCPMPWNQNHNLQIAAADLQSGEDAESILAKAIRDGGIEAVIDHENRWMISRQQVDVYTTSAPQEAYHARIAFCLDIHNEVSPSVGSYLIIIGLRILRSGGNTLRVRLV